MAQFTIITHNNSVLRVNAKSIQALTRALIDTGIKWQGIHEDKEPGNHGKHPKRVRRSAV